MVGNGGNTYAITDIKIDGKYRPVLLHRLVMNVTDKRKVDHRNRDSLCNCKHNLRVATSSQNGCNQKRQSNATTPYRGVYRAKRKDHWRSAITLDGKQYTLGTFNDIRHAAEAYDKAAKLLHGEFAALNFP